MNEKVNDKIIEIDSKKQVSVLAEPLMPDVLTNKKIIKLKEAGGEQEAATKIQKFTRGNATRKKIKKARKPKQ